MLVLSCFNLRSTLPQQQRKKGTHGDRLLWQWNSLLGKKERIFILQSNNVSLKNLHILSSSCSKVPSSLSWKKPTIFIFCLYSRSKMGCLRCISRVKSFHVKILLLDKQELIQEVTEKTTGQDLLDNVFKYLNLIETAYFGLRYQDNDNQTVS